MITRDRPWCNGSDELYRTLGEIGYTIDPDTGYVIKKKPDGVRNDT